MGSPNKSLKSSRSSVPGIARIRAAIAGVVPGRSRPLVTVAGTVSKSEIEPLENRLLLSGYALSYVAHPGVNDNGTDPQSSPVVDTNGNLYGTTTSGGAYGYGTLFEMAKGSNTITTLASFNDDDGADPFGPMVLDATGNLWGTTYAGGADGDGTVFEIVSGSNAITTLVSFNGTNGALPHAGLRIDGLGNLYGTTQQGGVNNDGTAFEIAVGSTALTTLASFSAATGSTPADGLALDTSGNLYGITSHGGSYDSGTVFEIAHGSGAITTVFSFGQSGTTVFNHGNLTVDAAGDLFGTTTWGGPNNGGTLFEIARASGAMTILATFNDYTNGGVPEGTLAIDAAGNLFGTASSGGPSYSGLAYEVAAGSASMTTLAVFNGADGAVPVGGLTLDGSDNLYGTTKVGGANNTGTIFEIAQGSSTATVLSSFDSSSVAGAWLSRDASGNLYGTSSAGGANGDGSVFEIASGSNSVTTLASFNGQNGSYPEATVTIDGSGNLYGTTSSGGNAFSGTVFEVAAGSTAITTLASFQFAGATGSNPESPLTLDASGNLYGACPKGGAFGYGTIFEIAKGSNTLTTVASFDTDGWGCRGPLTMDAAGDLYGTAPLGNDGGTVFKIAKGSNAITLIASFVQGPDGGVVIDSSGNLYGTADSGGAYEDGRIFEIAAGSTMFTTLASFNGANGAKPDAALTLDASGNLFGTTTSGGTANSGTAFELARGSKTITVLASFSVADAGNGGSYSGLILDPLGNLYGTTVSSDPGGSVFELNANTAVALTQGSQPNPSQAGQPLTFTATVTGGVPDGETVTLVDASNNNAVVATGTLSGGSATLSVPAGRLSPGTHNLVAAYAGDANLAASESPSYAQTVQVVAPSIVGSPVVNGDDPNGLYRAAGQSAPGTQRSMIEDIVYTFDEPVTIINANMAFTLAVAGPAGGTLPTTLYAQAVAGSNGAQWAVSLTGQPEGTIASIANGEYSITINPAYVLAAADGTTSMAAGTGRTDQFYRLFGDVFGTQNVTALDYNRFKSSLTTYNPMFDNYNTGNITALDYNLFKKDLTINYAGDEFVTTI